MVKSKSTTKQEIKFQVTRNVERGQFVPKKYEDSHPNFFLTEVIKKKKA